MSISDNVERKKIIKTLQDEISILQNELLDVRRRNMALESRVKKMERENSRLGGAVSCFLLLGLLDRTRRDICLVHFHTIYYA